MNSHSEVSWFDRCSVCSELDALSGGSTRSSWPSSGAGDLCTHSLNLKSEFPSGSIQQWAPLRHRTWRAASQNTGIKVTTIQLPSGPAPVNREFFKFRSPGRTCATHQNHGKSVRVLLADHLMQQFHRAGSSVVPSTSKESDHGRGEFSTLCTYESRRKMRGLPSPLETGEAPQGATGSMHGLPYQASYTTRDGQPSGRIPQLHRYRGAVHHLPQNRKQPRKSGPCEVRRLPQEREFLEQARRHRASTAILALCTISI